MTGFPSREATLVNIERARRFRALREILDDDTAVGHDLVVQLADNHIELTPADDRGGR